MTESRKVVKVFLASPGDLIHERKAAKAVADEFNTQYAEAFGYQVELIGWEDTVSVYGRPQATINRELERCELFVGMMWKKWGTPPDTNGTYSSGFEEEFETTVLRRLEDGRPEISLMFKEIDSEFLRDPGDDLKKVLAFKTRLIADKKILFEDFPNTQEFEKRFRRCISSYVVKLQKREAEEVSVQNQAPKLVGERPQVAEENRIDPETPLSTEGVKFLRTFISKTARDADENLIAAVDVARFRLLANIVGNNGNDVNALGVHDANLLFADGVHFTFGQHELTGLLNSGFEHYAHENAPLWRWFKEIDGCTGSILPKFSVDGSSAEMKAGALAAMRLISEPLPSDQQVSRKLFHDIWFAEDMASAVKVAALAYLGNCGITADLQAINQELDRSDYQTTSAAADAIIRINFRDSREKAVRSLFELQPTSISRKILTELFDNTGALSTEMLLNGVGHRNSDVRRIVIEILCNRGELPLLTAEQLLNDNDAKIRYEALKSLINVGRSFSDIEAHKIIVKENEQIGLGLMSAGTLDSGDTHWSHFQLHRLRSLDDRELEVAVIKDSIFNRDPQFILAERQFKRRGEDLRRCIDNQYKEEFSRTLNKKIKQNELNLELIATIRKLEKFLRANFTRTGLDIICRKAESCDLGRVRLTLKSGFVVPSLLDIEYLRKFGEWEDIPLVIDLVRRTGFESNNIWSIAFDETKNQIAARAIYELGRGRLPELLAMLALEKLLSQCIVEIPDNAFGKLSDESINLLLRSENDLVRKSAALKCIKSFPKGRIKKLLKNYVSDGQFRYYNVIHWLDFGVSIPKDRASLAAKKVLNKS